MQGKHVHEGEEGELVAAMGDLDASAAHDEPYDHMQVLRHAASSEVSRIYMRGMGLGDAEAREIAGFLLKAQMQTVSSISLACNRIGDQGAEALLGALEGCPRITRLDLSENQVSDRVLALLDSALENNRALARESRPERPSDVWITHKQEEMFIGHIGFATEEVGLCDADDPEGGNDKGKEKEGGY